MSVNRIYWNEADQKHICLYVNSKVKETKDRYFSLLYPTIAKMIDSVNYKNGFKLTEDSKQEVMIRMYEYVLPRITMNKVQAAYAYIYTSIANLSRNEVRTRNGKYSHDKVSIPLSDCRYDIAKDIDAIIAYIGDKTWVESTFTTSPTIEEQPPETVAQALAREIRMSTNRMVDHPPNAG